MGKKKATATRQQRLKEVRYIETAFNRFIQQTLCETPHVHLVL